MMRIVFIGCVKSSKVFLETLIGHNYEVVGIVTQQSSAYNADFFDLGELGEKNKIPYIYVKNVNDDNSINFIKKVHPDVVYCFGWSQLIKEELLRIPTKGCFGFHPAQLPNNRGRHPIIWALVLGLPSTASTFFRMDTLADTGEIVSQKNIEILYTDYAIDLYNKILDVAQKQIIELTEKLISDEIDIIQQDLKCGNNWRKRNGIDGEIDWRMSTYAIYNLVRALSKPYVGAHFMYNGKQIKVWKVEEEKTDAYLNIEPGKILSVASNECRIKAYDGVIKLIEFDACDLKEGEYL